MQRYRLQLQQSPLLLRQQQQPLLLLQRRLRR